VHFVGSYYIGTWENKLAIGQFYIHRAGHRDIFL